jgi:tetratricopeptide (TPR) repeat protein
MNRLIPTVGILMLTGIVYLVLHLNSPTPTEKPKKSTVTEPHTPLLVTARGPSRATAIQPSPSPSEEEQTEHVFETAIRREIKKHFLGITDEDVAMIIEMGHLEDQAHDLSEKNKLAEAEKIYKTIIDLWEKLPPVVREDKDSRSTYAIWINNMALAQADQDKYAEAKANYAKALELHRGLYGEYDMTVAKDLNNLGVTYLYEKNYDEAEKVLKASLEIRERLEGRDHYDISVPTLTLGEIAEARGNYAAAEAYYLRALELRTRELGVSDPKTFRVASDLAGLYLRMKRPKDNQRIIDTYYAKPPKR